MTMNSGSAGPRAVPDSNAEDEVPIAGRYGLDPHSPTARSGIAIQSIDSLPIALTVPEAAALLRIGRTLAYELVHQWHATGGAAGLRSVRVGRALRIPRTAVLEFLDIADPARDAASGPAPGTQANVATLHPPSPGLATARRGSSGPRGIQEVSFRVSHSPLRDNVWVTTVRPKGSVASDLATVGGRLRVWPPGPSPPPR